MEQVTAWIKAIPEWILYALLSAVLAGLFPNFLKMGSKKAAPALGAAILSFFTLVFSVIVNVIRNQESFAFNDIPFDMLRYVILMGIVRGFYFLFLTTGLIHGGLNRVIPITNLSTVALIGISYVFEKQMPGIWKLVSVIILLLGTILVESGPERNSNPLWVLFAFLALLTGAAHSFLGELFYTEAMLGEETINIVECAVSFIILLIIAAIGGAFRSMKKVGVDGWVFLILAGMCAGLSLLCDKTAAAFGNPAFLKPIACASFPAAMLGARIFHKEEFPSGAMFGILLILVGMFGLLLELNLG